MIGGDVNLPDINWNDNTIDGHTYSNEFNQTFLDQLEKSNLQQIVKEPTRKDKTLDLFLTNRPPLVNRCSLMPGISDHDIVCVDTNASARRTKPTRRKIYLWKNADTEKLKSECLSFQKDFLNKYDLNSSVDTIWKDIKSHLQTSN